MNDWSLVSASSVHYLGTTRETAKTRSARKTACQNSGPGRATQTKDYQWLGIQRATHDTIVEQLVYYRNIYIALAPALTLAFAFAFTHIYIALATALTLAFAFAFTLFVFTAAAAASATCTEQSIRDPTTGIFVPVGRSHVTHTITIVIINITFTTAHRSRIG